MGEKERFPEGSHLYKVKIAPIGANGTNRKRFSEESQIVPMLSKKGQNSLYRGKWGQERGFPEGLQSVPMLSKKTEIDPTETSRFYGASTVFILPRSFPFFPIFRKRSI